MVKDLTLIRHEHVLTHIMGKELKHFAHKSDVSHRAPLLFSSPDSVISQVMRLEALLNSGGIYLDIDVFVYVHFVIFALAH